MTIEQKVQRYDEALKRAKKLYEQGTITESLAHVFPELAESEDEKVRKEIMDFIDTKTIDSDERRNRWFSYLEKYKLISFTSLEDTEVKMSLMQYISELNQDVVHLHPGIETCNEWIAWLENIPYTIDHEKREGFYLGYKAGLEKQGEQSSLNINRECLKGIKRVQEYQDLSDWEKEFDNIASMYAHNKNQEGYNDSWYVKERAAEMLYYAKDELEKQSGQNTLNYENISIQQKDFASQKNIPRYSIGDVLCDKSCTTLNKESQPNFEITDIRNGMYICDKGSFPISQQDEYELVAKKMEQESTWNEENTSFISDLLDYFGEDKCLKHEVNDIVEWLKTIKPQQKGWSENEIKMLDNLITYLDGRKDLLEEIKSTYIDWLKSLKQRIGG